ncbi:MAG: (Fe-S)-binding protein [candidate division WOR-3 bacterium]
MLNKFIDTIKKRISRPLQYYKDICVRCGACIDACHFYVASRNPAHIPAYRMMLIKKLLKDNRGPYLKWYREFPEIDERYIDELRKALWECTGCRRCAVFCPFNLDTGLLVSAGRFALMEENMGLEMVSEIGNAEVSKGEIIDSIKDFYIEQTRDLAARLQREWRISNLEIPVNKKGARVLYIPLVGEHSVAPVVKIFYAAKEDWTMSLFTATNHSFFVGDIEKAKKAAHWIVQEARQLGVKVIVYPECGHATRTLMNYFDKWFGEEIEGIERISIVKLVAQYFSTGRIHLRQNIFNTPLTYHDPCNIGRNAGLYEEPRQLIRVVATDFIEMTPNRELNWCCGGGGGLIAEPEMKEIRMRAGRKKVEQIRRTGARWVVTTCENCKTQLGDLNEYYKLGIEIKGVVDLVAEALTLRGRVV